MVFSLTLFTFHWIDVQKYNFSIKKKPEQQILSSKKKFSSKFQLCLVNEEGKMKKKKTIEFHKRKTGFYFIIRFCIYLYILAKLRHWKQIKMRAKLFVNPKYWIHLELNSNNRLYGNECSNFSFFGISIIFLSFISFDLVIHHINHVISLEF